MEGVMGVSVNERVQSFQPAQRIAGGRPAAHRPEQGWRARG
jgi:hypothetical protein